MPKATKDHRSKKNPHSHEAFRRRKTEANAADKSHKWFQGEWRKSCISDRAILGTLTEKNRKEAEGLGVKLPAVATE